MSEELRKIYIVDYSFSELRVVSALINKETAKQHQLVPNSTRYLIGRWLYLPTRIAKDQYTIFDSFEEAKEWGIRQLREDIARTEDKVISLSKKLKEVSAIGNPIEKKEYEV